MKKLCIAFSIVWGILFALFLSLCLVSFLAHPVDLGETLLLAYEDLTGDLGHSVAGMWNRLAWICLFVSIAMFVLFSLNLVGAILFKPVEAEEEDSIIKDQTPIETEPQAKKAMKEPKERKENIFKSAFKKIASKFKKHEKETKKEVEEVVEEKVEEVVEKVDATLTKKQDTVSNYLSQFKRK